ncbi:MAG: hypothetical protein IT330_02280 [Anaerolineae bacterium]|nr:hypothetical protein [Anaerolineae bacterium]
MRRAKPDSVAWIVLLTSFILCCSLGIGIPLAARWYILSSMVPRLSRLDVLNGTILVQEPGAKEPVGVTAPRLVPEGSRIITDGTSRGVLTFMEDATAQLYNNTQLTIVQARSPRFSLSRSPNQVVLEISGGLVRVARGNSGSVHLNLQVRTPHALSELSEGSLSLAVNNEETQVTARFGKAQVVANGSAVTLNAGERTAVRLNGSPAAPLSAQQNLIVNGDFTGPLTPAWQVEHYEQGENLSAGRVEVTSSAGRRAVMFIREGEEGVHTETRIKQFVDRDVRDFESLVLRLDVLLLHQSLAGAGYLSSEFPLMVRLDYTDIYGKDQFWVYGFYFKDPDPSQGWIVQNGERIPSAVWWPYESPELLDLLKDTPPARINAITIYASGWNYQSMVAEVGLIAR